MLLESGSQISIVLIFNRLRIYMAWNVKKLEGFSKLPVWTDPLFAFYIRNLPDI
jgi:hypothetical protein